MKPNAESREFVDFMLRAARKKLGLSDDWQWCVLEAIGETRDSLLTLGVPRILTKGPRKGKQTYRGVPTKQCVVTLAERIAEERAYEKETHKCANCFGSGQESAGWDHIKGSIYRRCHVCNETGLARVEKKAALA